MSKTTTTKNTTVEEAPTEEYTEIDESNAVVPAPKVSTLADLFIDSLTSRGLTTLAHFEIPEVHMVRPSGGQKTGAFQTADMRLLPEVVGVVLYAQQLNNLWHDQDSLTAEGKKATACRSNDGIHGYPTGAIVEPPSEYPYLAKKVELADGSSYMQCGADTCPHMKYKALWRCSASLRLYVLPWDVKNNRPASLLPFAVVLPSTSFTRWNKYKRDLGKANKAQALSEIAAIKFGEDTQVSNLTPITEHTVLTKITVGLNEQRNGSNKYALANFEMLNPLAPETAEQLLELSHVFYNEEEGGFMTIVKPIARRGDQVESESNEEEKAEAAF